MSSSFLLGRMVDKEERATILMEVLVFFYGPPNTRIYTGTYIPCGPQGFLYTSWLFSGTGSAQISIVYRVKGIGMSKLDLSLVLASHGFP